MNVMREKENTKSLRESLLKAIEAIEKDNETAKFQFEREINIAIIASLRRKLEMIAPWE